MSGEIQTLEDLLVLGRTIYGEARGESFLGKTAVAHVILNRVKGRHRKESTVIGVCTEPYQFSAWNENDPNRDRIQSVLMSDLTYQECLAAALMANRPDSTDPTHGATFYHTREIMPTWAQGHTPSKEIGSHVFYNTVR